MKINKILMFLIALTYGVYGQEEQGNVNNLPVREHTITLREATVNKAGKNVMVLHHKSLVAIDHANAQKFLHSFHFLHI